MVDKFGDDPLKPLNIIKKPARAVAVALAESTTKAGTPAISAAGRGKIAEQILQLAFENGIRVRQDSALAEMLAALELDSPVPSEALAAVAEILAYVYMANGQPNPFDVAIGDGKDESMTEPDSPT